MAGTLVKKVMLRIASDDGDTEEKLDKISAKADELARKHPDLKVKIDTGAAAAKLAVLKRELRDVDKQGEESRFTFKGLSSDIAEMATGLGAGSGAVGEMSMFQKVLLGLNVATGLGEPLIAGLTVAVGGLSAGLVSAGAGLGVFGVVAKSVWSGVSSNISAAYAAQQKIANGATGKKLIADNKALAASLKGLNDGQKQLVLGASNAELAWHNFVQHSAAGVASVLVPALALVPKGLALIKPFLAPVESALRGIVAGLGRSMSSGGLKSFMDVMSKNAGPMLTDLAHAIENIASGLGGILKTFMPVAHQMMHGLDDITGKFAKWGNTLSGHSGFKSLMSMFKSETPLAVGALKSLGGIIKTVVSQMTGMSTFSNSKMLLQLAGPVLKFANALLKAHPQLVWLVLYLKLGADGGKKLKGAFEGISGALGGLKTAKGALSDLKSGFSDAGKAADDATGAWGTMGGKLSTVLQKLGLMKAAQGEAAAATEAETGAQDELDASMDANPIGLIVLAVAALGIGMYELIKHVTPVRDFFKDLWKDLKNWFSDGINFIKSHWKLLPAIFLGPLGIVVTLVLTHFKQIKQIISDALHAVEDVAKDVWHWFVDYIMIQVDAVKTVLSVVREAGVAVPRLVGRRGQRGAQRDQSSAVVRPVDPRQDPGRAGRSRRHDAARGRACDRVADFRHHQQDRVARLDHERGRQQDRRVHRLVPGEGGPAVGWRGAVHPRVAHRGRRRGGYRVADS